MCGYQGTDRSGGNWFFYVYHTVIINDDRTRDEEQGKDPGV